MKKFIGYCLGGFLMSCLNLMFLLYIAILFQAETKTQIVFYTAMLIICCVLNISTNLITGWFLFKED